MGHLENIIFNNHDIKPTTEKILRLTQINSIFFILGIKSFFKEKKLEKLR